MKKILIGLIITLMLITVIGCGYDNNIEKQYDLWMYNQLTGEKMSDDVRFTVYKDGTFACGEIIMESDNVEDAENECYGWIEMAVIADMWG